MGVKRWTWVGEALRRPGGLWGWEGGEGGGVPSQLTWNPPLSHTPVVNSTCSDFNHGSALHIAASNLCLGAAKCLLEHGANPALRVLRPCPSPHYLPSPSFPTPFPRQQRTKGGQNHLRF